MIRRIRAFRDILPEQSVGVLIRAALPGASRITDVHLDVCGHGKPLVFRKFLSSIPRQRFVEFAGQLVCVFYDGLDHRLGILTVNLSQHHVTRLSFHQGGDMATLAT